MPGKRTPADPGDINKSVDDISAQQAGIQSPSSAKGVVGAQFENGEAPPENAYREVPNRKD